MKIKKGDSVIVIAGKDKGKSGKVARALPREEQVLVEGVNVVRRHQRARRRNSQGQIIEQPMPIHVSNVALTEGGKPVRAGYKVEDGKKVRVSKKSGKAL
jgi:large subunit ribosomal protein L24